VLVRSNLFDVVVALDLARKVFAKIRWNLAWAVLYNFLAIPFAAGILFPWTHMLVPPQYAGLMMAFSSVSVVLSSLSLKLYKRPMPCTSSECEADCIDKPVGLGLVNESLLKKGHISLFESAKRYVHVAYCM
jgi:hypothetical protein